MIIGLQDEFSSQLHAVPLIVYLIDQHCIEVFILEGETDTDSDLQKATEILHTAQE